MSINKDKSEIAESFRNLLKKADEMALDKKKDDFLEKNLKDLDEICEECHKEDESVTQNLIMTGYKLCKSCRTSKTVFPL